MTKEELELEAEEYANNIDYTTTVKMIDCVPYHENCDVADMIAEAYLAGAESREKRIAELERKLKVETELSNRLGLAYREYEELTKEQDEHLAELEKENAELKKQLGMSNKVYNDNLDYSHHIEEQLTNAKEIIRSLYSVIQDRIDYKGNIPLEDEMYRAKQYLE